ncbi:unnamed protein product, partial [Allacma fusca]
MKLSVDDKEADSWCQRYLHEYLDKLLRVWNSPYIFETFLKSRSFVKAIMGITKTRLRCIAFHKPDA